MIANIVRDHAMILADDATPKPDGIFGKDTKSGHFKPEKFEDHYEDALKELLRKKQSGQKIEVPRERAPAKVINLMDALRRSVDAERGGGGRGEGERRAAASRQTPKKAARSNARKRTG